MSVGLINPEVAEKGGRIAKAMMEGGASGWSTLIGKNVSYAIGETDYGIPAEVVKPEEMGESVITPVDWSGDTEGKVWLIVPSLGAKEVVAYMMALMLGGDPNPDTQKLDAEGMDAYSEAVNSFVGQGAQQARGEVGGTIKTAIGASKMVDFKSASPEAEIGKTECLAVKIKVTIEGCSPFTLEMLIARSVTGVAPEINAGAAEEEREAVAAQLGIDPNNLAIAMKIKLPLVVNIATKKMRMELIQGMCPGTIIEFRKMSGENLDVIAANVRVATAEAVITNQCFGVQVRNIVDPKMHHRD
ncbi:MAG: FliM/FliN family flagellar motor switch protein [Planctomycetota bacterium]|jgi:flagellar motor switch/type III secretory pathway protein FliN|nr:FliM/FliN family flagellar motor switch protein [Planctomycetota bacterium]